MNIRAPLHRLTLAGGIVALLSACPPPPASNDGGDMMDAGCAGLIGCECSGGSCTTGECLNGTCTDCRRGEAACTCRANGTCNTGLRCTNSTCQTCPAGELGCPCGTGDTCGTGLTCSSGTCVADTCTAGASSCPCRSTDPKCDGDQYCDGTTRCQTCSNDVIGCPCVSGACTGSTTCDSTTQRCRAPVTCANLRAANMCLPNQECLEMNGMDATCTAGTCVAGFKWTGTACVMCQSANCANEPSCSGDGGLAATCSLQNRECNQVGQLATCGACRPGFTELPGTDGGQGTCIAVPTCGSRTCSLLQYCETSSGTPTCTSLPCTQPGFAVGSNTMCSPCSRSCTGPGLSGRLWPFKAGDDSCVCETLDGYYFGSGNNAEAAKCDADNDGWVREEALAVRSDPALRANSRCNIQLVDRVRLFDEYGLSVDVLSCSTGLVKASLALADAGVPNGGVGILGDGGLAPGPDGGAACPAAVPLELVETEFNDVGRTQVSAASPRYGSGGRFLNPAELNSLTKGCITTTGDFNDNAVDDIAEVQTNLPTRPNVTANRARLENFAYFMELNTAYTVGRTLVIKERSRCDATFPFRYASDAGTEPYVSDAGAPYWRTCSRGREPSFNLASGAPGYDFAQFICDFPSGGCNIVPPPHPSIVAPTDPNFVLMRKHGLCDLNGLPPADGRWRGMTHHSQYKCVNVVSTLNANSKAWDTLEARFVPGLNNLTFNECVARPCGTDGGCAGTFTTQGSGAQTLQPVIDCQPRAAAVSGQVGFAAVNFKTGAYQGGCVNEDTLFSTFLCPSPTYSLDSTRLETNYGRYSCFGRPANFLWCGTPCNETISTLRWAPTTKGQGEPTGTPVFR